MSLQLFLNKQKSMDNPRKITIVIPTYRNLKYLKATVNSIFTTTDYPFKMIIVACEEDKETVKWLHDLVSNYPECIQVIYGPKLGSIKALNDGIRLAIQEGAQDIYCTQDDVLFYPYRDWLKDYAEYSIKNNAGLLTSCGLRLSGADYIEGLPWVGSWDMFIPERTLNLVGLPDQSFQIGEDIDYSYRVNKADLKIINFQDFQTIVHHQKRETPHQPQGEDIKKANAKKFREKHKL